MNKKMTGTSLNTFLFLISILFDFYLFIIFLRLALGLVHADYFNPTTQFVVKATDVFIKPMKKIIPDIRGFETATLVFMLLVEMVKYFIIGIFSFGLPNFLGLLILSIGDVLNIILIAVAFILIIQFLLSWIMPGTPNLILYKFTAPLIAPVRRVIPAIAGVDISPLIIAVIFLLLIKAVAIPIKGYGLGLANIGF
jgi:YggT family protein